MNYGYQQPPIPQKPKRSVVKLVFGIILTVIGGLGLLGQLASLSSGMGPSPTSVGEASGFLIGLLLFIVVPLVAGIWLIVRSRPKP